MSHKHLLPAILLLLGIPLLGQDVKPSTGALLESILIRMDTLEKQNQQMADQIRELRQQLESKQAPAALDDRVAVTENRLDEQAQTKVEAAQKLPVTFTGQILFNAFANAGNLRTPANSTSPDFVNTGNSAGATARQTMLGFDFRGPSLPGDGKVSAHMMLDFYAGTPTEQLAWLRLRTSDISLDWVHRSLTFAFDKPLISPRQPDSLAEVAIPALASSGNLWLWTPQVRYQERLMLGNSAGITAQAAILQTDETYNYLPPTYASSLEKTRPALEGRLALWKNWNDNQRLELATGYHESTTHVAAASALSRIYSVDWLVAPLSRVQVSGTFLHGQNLGVLGALSDGFSFFPNGNLLAVHANAGWTQVSTAITNRLTMNLFAGFEDNRNPDVVTGSMLENLSYAGNLMYHLSSNVIMSFEGLQMRTRIKQGGDIIHNRYDLALAYRF